MTDLLHRIRWANVARAAALLLAALLALAWPRLKAHDDGLPPGLTEPVTVAREGAEAAPHPASNPAPAPRVATHQAARRKAAKRRAAKAATAQRAHQRRRTVARRRRMTGLPE